MRPTPLFLLALLVPAGPASGQSDVLPRLRAEVEATAAYVRALESRADSLHALLLTERVAHGALLDSLESIIGALRATRPTEPEPTEPEPTEPEPTEPEPTEPVTNEPPDLTPLWAHSWAAQGLTGWDLAFADETRSVALAEVPDGPGGVPGTVLRHTYPPNHMGGGGVEPHRSITGNRREVYMRTTFRHSTNFHGHGSGINKLGYLKGDTGSGGWGGLWFTALGSGGNPLRPQFTPQLGGCGDQGNYRAPTSVTMPRGVWHDLEVHLNLDTAHVRWWLNGDLVIDSPICVGNTPRIHGVWLSGMMGGVGPSGNPDGQTLDFGNVYVSGR